MTTTTQKTSTQLAKTYDPASIEPQALRVWNDEKLFHAGPTDPGKPYSIVIPPPNVTAALHLGHALNNTLQDILIRWHRMLGDNTVWLPGTDHAGIATQTVVEKRVLKEEGRKRTDFKREEFVAKIQAWKDEYERTITQQLKAMGCSCDWERQAFTMDEPRARAVREAFFQLFKAGLIYRGKRLVNWDPATQTALADDEVENEEIDGHFYYLRYALLDDDPPQRAATIRERSASDAGQDRSLTVAARYVTVATTRPETMLGDTAVAINPRDPRAAILRGKKVRLPIVDRIIPIIEDDYVVLPDPNSDDPKAKYATGFLKVTPAHDPNDYDIGQRHGLPMINVLAPDGSISDRHGWTDVGGADFVLGLDRYEARRAVVEWFKRNKLLEEVKPYRHSVGHSYRSHVPIEPYLSDQWYLKVTDDRLAGAALRAMSRDQLESRDTPKTSRDREGADSAENTRPTHAYFITFTCYGTWLHGDDRGSADREHNVPGTPYLVGDEERERREFESLKHPAMTLDERQRQIVQQTIAEVCQHRGWELLAAHVRPKHVHTVLLASETPEKVMNDFKAYATRRLREAKVIGDETRVWTRHGSTRYLNDEGSIQGATTYVVEDQGAPLTPSPFDARNSTSRERERAEQPRVDNRKEEPLPYGRGSSSPSQSEGAVGWEGKLRFYPARYAKTFQTWHENLRDWCISRQLWWGHRIPVWRQIRPSSDPHPTEGVEGWWKHEAKVRRDEIALAPDLSEPGKFFVCLRDRDESLERILKKDGFEQDPDVLDTWFSSGLWPMSTLGWPDETPALAKWNPTSVLCTAREIITLWVSRMVMFNLFFRDALPFYDVSIHPMVQDGEGRKMSKSLGNGVDPLDIIHTHGADAMRFTLAHMTTQTQDVRMPVEKDPATGKNTSPKFDIGRNFCNKLWNAVRFALSNLENVPAEPIDESRWSIADRWIMSRAVRTVKTVNETLSEYRFDAYAKACYDFFWRDLCDWYIEAIKPAMRDPHRAPQTSAVLALALDVSLRLMHPMIPFITETLWWKLNELRPQRGLPGKLPGGDNSHLIRARFPVYDDAMDTLTSSGAEFVMDKLQELITAIRTVRNDHKVDPKRSVIVSIRTPENTGHQLQTNREMIELLAICKLAELGPDVQAPANAAKTTACGCEIYVQGVVDEAAEQQRVIKQREVLTKKIATMEARMANAGYVAKAPPHLIEQTKAELAAAKAELEKLR